MHSLGRKSQAAVEGRSVRLTGIKFGKVWALKLRITD